MTLFILKINDIVNVIKPGIDKSLFVDDFPFHVCPKVYPLLNANYRQISIK